MGVKDTLTLYILGLTTIFGTGYFAFKKLKGGLLNPANAGETGSKLVETGSEFVAGAGKEFTRQVNESETTQKINEALAQESIAAIDNDRSLRTNYNISIWDQQNYGKMKDVARVMSFKNWVNSQPKIKVAFINHAKKMQKYLTEHVGPEIYKADKLGALTTVVDNIPLEDWAKVAKGVVIRRPRTYRSWPYAATADSARQAQEEFAKTREGGGVGSTATTDKGTSRTLSGMI